MTIETIKEADLIIEVAKPIIDILAPRLQEAMKDFAERLMILSEKYPSIKEFALILDHAADILGDILYALGIDTEHADVLGAKIAQTDKKVDDFSSVEEYIAYLKNDVELDKQKFDALAEEEKISYTIVGIAVEASAVGEKLSVEIPVDIVELVAKIMGIGKIVVDAKELISIVSILKLDGIENLSDICDLINGAGPSDRSTTREALTHAINETMGGEEGRNIIYEIIDEIRR
jgi:hypothetical protein